MKELDDIADAAALEIFHYGPHKWNTNVIRSAIDKAIEFVLTREPTMKMLEDGDTAFENGYVDEVWRAMQAALLEELKHETRR